MSKADEGLMPSGVVQEMVDTMGALKVSVVSPARPLYEGEAIFVAAPALGGEVGIYSKHADLVSALGVGLLRIKRGKQDFDRFAVRKGFLEVSGDHVTVLVGDAATAEDVDEPAVQEELKLIIAALAAPKSEEHFQELLDQRAWCQVRLKLLREPDLGF